MLRTRATTPDRGPQATVLAALPHTAPATPPAATAAAPMPKRLRLPPEERMPQILEGALAEFSERGYAATRMDDIARRCNLSKGGLYAHFESKESILEALLGQISQAQDWHAMPHLSATAGTRELARWLMERLYAELNTPQALAMLRLLLAESQRVPHLMTLWRTQVLEPRGALLAAELADRLPQLKARNSVILREPWLLTGMVVQYVLSRAIFGDSQWRTVAQARDAHVDLLCELIDGDRLP